MADGSKKFWVPSDPSAPSDVARTFELTGGGSSILTAWSSVCWNTLRSGFGKRFGTTRSVSMAIPAGTSGTASRSASASFFARANRVGDPGARDASIDREVSRTKNTWASVRTRALSVDRSAGCIAARPSSNGHRDERGGATDLAHARRRPQAEDLAGPVLAARREREPGERNRDREHGDSRRRESGRRAS